MTKPRTPEQSLNDLMRDAFRVFHYVRVENTARDGTPDISTVKGWIESKVTTRYTKGVVKIPHYTPGQRGWHVAHRGAGGACFVALKLVTSIGPEYYLLDALDAAQHLGVDWTRADLIFHNLVDGEWSFDPSDWRKALVRESARMRR